MAKLNVKKGDTVLVIAGKDNGKTAEVLDCFPSENKVTVKGINVVVKHKKPRSAQDKGGIIKLECKIPASNVMVVCPVCNKATRIKIGENEKGEKVRICKKCLASLDSSVKKSATKKAETKKVEAKAEEKPAAKKATKTATAEKKTTAKETKAETKTTKTATAKKATAKKSEK